MHNRIIKFRAWDKKEKEMIYPVTMIEMPPSYIGYINGWNKEGVARSIERIGKNKPIELMQFTGLFDKNGKEIYCSDIVKGYFNPSKAEDWVWLSLTDKDKVNGWKLFVIPDDIVEFARTYYPDELEVIGNVFENPELLSEIEKPND